MSKKIRNFAQNFSHMNKCKMHEYEQQEADRVLHKGVLAD